MNKPNKKLIEKLRLFSELSYDGIIRISESGNYFVRTSGPTIVDIQQEFRPEIITRGTYNKLLSKIPVKYEVHQNMLMLTKTGKLLLGKPKGTTSAYKRGIKWETINTRNFRKNAYWIRIDGKEQEQTRKIIQKIIFQNSKSKWLLDKKFFTLEDGLHHRILYNYKSITEMRRDLGYGFLTDKTFEGLFTHGTEEESLYNYCTFIFDIILFGKLFSEKSRKNLVIVLLSIFAKNEHHNRWDVLSELNIDFTNYIKKRKIDNKPFVELPNDLKNLTKALSPLITNSNTDDDDDEEQDELPF